jgi:hypothetical protein
MRGVVVKVEDSSAVVLFNNGKIGRIPAPPGCKRGAVITVSLNKKMIFIPAVSAALLIILGGLFGFYMLTRGVSPEEFCRRPFVDKNIVIPNGEYAGYEALFAHIGRPEREFTPDYPVVKNEGDAVRGLNFEDYNLITCYDHNRGMVTVFELILNSKSSPLTGKFSIGDDRSVMEKYFKPYTSGNKKGIVFSYKNNDMQFVMENAVLTFKFNGKNKLTGVVISRPK